MHSSIQTSVTQSSTQSSARHCSVQPTPSSIAQPQTDIVPLIAFGSLISMVLVGALVSRLHRQYRAEVLRQQVEALEKLWRKTFLEKISLEGSTLPSYKL